MMFMVLTDSGRCNYLPFKEMMQVCGMLIRDCSFIKDMEKETWVSKEFVEQELNEKEPTPISLRYT